MNVTVIVISILVSVICVLLAILQYYYINYKKATFSKPYEPLFTDLIVNDFRTYHMVHYYANDEDNYIYKRSSKDYNKNKIDSEVEHCLKAALAYKVSGKNDKALRLFEHAAAMAPSNPDVLIQYGEYLEEMHKDVVGADELYFKALTYSPNHQVALSNHRRTAELVDKIDYHMFKIIDEKRDMLKEQLRAGYDDEVKRKLYYLHIYHTVGIEGNTMTIPELEYLLKTGMVVAGKTIQEHNEVLGLEIALHYIKLLTGANIIGVSEILEIHRRVMGHVRPLQSGIFREEQVFVGGHVPPSPEELPHLMEMYVEWLNSDEAQSMHPVRYAALAHYKLVDIHPFTDGNGRTSRLIMNLILLRSGYPPVIISKGDRKKYYKYLKLANKGDLRPFVRFIAYSTDETLNTYLGSSQFLIHHVESIPIIQMNQNRNV
ncbi:hypothetical protein AMK59_7302 [Oryctes borbonicus]|uniref:Protein adenylyltransferase Fic n=1 Tax=Oryctes borbonicus TaxID=1629725 RepID=A0A0T6AUT6_9SCAR|nr:hypothetical protein AMK59_7302 [Oryctes borbonicus]